MGIMQMILIQVWTNRLIYYASIEQSFGKSVGREKEAKFFSSKNQFIISKLNSKDFAEELIVRKVSEMMHVWFTFKGES